MNLQTTAPILNDKFVDEITNKYLKSINKDIWNEQELIKNGKYQKELHQFNLPINKLRSRLNKNIEKIRKKYQVEEITQLGDMHRGNQCTLLMNLTFL